MLKDLLNTLQQATVESEQRMAESAGALGAYGTAQSAAAMGIGAAPSRKGGRPVGNSNIPAGKLGAFIKAMREQESGGRYGVVNSIGAMGAYQIMPSNILGPGGWDKEILGRNVSRGAFLNNRGIQDRIAQGKMRQYFNQYGAAGAAKAWYAGPGNARLNSDRPQSGGPSINDYARSVLRKMRKYQ
jgi:hypothetical protein